MTDQTTINWTETLSTKNVAEMARSEAATTYWVKMANGWTQGSIGYSNGYSSGTRTETPVRSTSTGSTGGPGMTWDAVHVLLQHLGFTATAYRDYVTYTYRGLRNFAFSIPPKTVVAQWSDAQVREILAYGYALIVQYEETARVPVAAPPPPLSELEVEEW